MSGSKNEWMEEDLGFQRNMKVLGCFLLMVLSFIAGIVFVMFVVPLLRAYSAGESNGARFQSSAVPGHRFDHFLTVFPDSADLQVQVAKTRGLSIVHAWTLDEYGFSLRHGFDHFSRVSDMGLTTFWMGQKCHIANLPPEIDAVSVYLYSAVLTLGRGRKAICNRLAIGRNRSGVLSDQGKLNSSPFLVQMAKTRGLSIVHAWTLDERAAISRAISGSNEGQQGVDGTFLMVI